MVFENIAGGVQMQFSCRRPLTAALRHPSFHLQKIKNLFSSKNFIRLLSFIVLDEITP